MDSPTPEEKALAQDHRDRLARAREDESVATPADGNAQALARAAFVEQHRRLPDLDPKTMRSATIYVGFPAGEPIPLTSVRHLLVVVDADGQEILLELGGRLHMGMPSSPGSTYLELGNGITLALHTNSKPNLG